MRRALLVSIAMFLGLGGAIAATGPEPGSPDFTVFTRELGQAGGTIYDETAFDTELGWDFGDRAAYACAFVEFFRDGELMFEVHYELFAGYPIPLEINDRNGREGDEGSFGCGNNAVPDDGLNDAKGADLVFDEATMGDHFPHGTNLEFFLDGAPLASIDYQDDPCARGYWTPGNSPGEAVLWWDADGPTNDGHAELACGGGPGSPVAIAFAQVQQMAPQVGVCTTDDLDGDKCLGTPLPPTGPTGPTGEPLCYSGVLVAEDGSGATLQARVCS